MSGSMNSGRANWPRSICLSLNSQSPVSSGLHNSGMLMPRNRASREKALAVGCNSRPERRRYFSKIKPSITAARVAGVPNPFAPFGSASRQGGVVRPAATTSTSH